LVNYSWYTLTDSQLVTSSRTAWKWMIFIENELLIFSAGTSRKAKD
jgi:hypothetical protein